MSETMSLKEKATRFLQEKDILECSAADRKDEKNIKSYNGTTSKGLPYVVNVGLFACSNAVDYTKVFLKTDGRSHLVTAMANGRIAVLPVQKSNDETPPDLVHLLRGDLARRLVSAGEQAIKQGVTSSSNPLDTALQVGQEAVCSIYAKPVAECVRK